MEEIVERPLSKLSAIPTGEFEKRTGKSSGRNVLHPKERTI